MAKRDAVAAWDLVGDGAQPFLCHPPHEGGWEELVVLAQDELGWHIWPGTERPWGVPDCCGLPAPASSQRLFSQGVWYSVIEADERVVVAGLATVQFGLLVRGLPVAGVGPALAWSLAGDRDHAGKQHEQPGRQTARRQGCGEGSVRL